jgi:hypothetical protein
MDTEREGIEAQDPLRALFIEAGHIAPAPGLTEKVLSALEAPADVAGPVPSLISGRAWVFLAFLLLTVLVIGSMLSPEGNGASTGPAAFPFLDMVPEVAETIRSRWMIAALAGLGTLVLIDHAIALRHRVNFTL